MTETIITALITGGLTLVGVLVSNNKSQSVADARSDERIKGLEQRFEALTAEVREHNNYARRMPVVEEQIKVINHRIKDLEDTHG